MAFLLNKLVEQYYYLNYEVSDQRVQKFFLMQTPWPMLTIAAFYLYFVYRLGPSIMANRPPMNIDRIVQVYNVVQIVLSAYICYQALVLGWLVDYKFSCEPVDYSDNPRAVAIAKTSHLYWIVKVIDLLDTVFFVLRKKNNQISFLHVYHHTAMVVGIWIGVKYIAGGHSTMLGMVNSFVHVVMYTHYLITSLRIWKPWWKKYITQLQLIQFFIILIHFLQLLFRDDCGYPLWPASIFVPQNLFMIVLFGDFYYKTYIKKPKNKVKTNGQSQSDTGSNKTKMQ